MKFGNVTSRPNLYIRQWVLVNCCLESKAKGMIGDCRGGHHELFLLFVKWWTILPGRFGALLKNRKNPFLSAICISLAGCFWNFLYKCKGGQGEYFILYITTQPPGGRGPTAMHGGKIEVMNPITIFVNLENMAVSIIC